MSAAELELKKENQINKNAYFLDLNIKIKNFRFQRKIYEKSDNFNFERFRMPY